MRRVPVNVGIESEARQAVAREMPDLYNASELLRLAMQDDTKARALLPAADRARLEAFEARERLEEWRAARIEEFEARDAQSPFEALVEQIHREKFNGEPGKYADAFMAAGEQRPELASAYVKGEQFAEVAPEPVLSSMGKSLMVNTPADYSNGAKSLARQIIAGAADYSPNDLSLLLEAVHFVTNKHFDPEHAMAGTHLHKAGIEALPYETAPNAATLRPGWNIGDAGGPKRGAPKDATYSERETAWSALIAGAPDRLVEVLGFRKV